ncbi:hypothetical protein ACFQU9_22210 [Actinomadura namibiensis]|uniref:Methyltransferase n=1 Tax=Actinomadura namibiensis TaxID=182080 RepID=A0A7W3LQJ6_ACTNM|nr:hypothetical protein [Actinomadura namibiensis]
MGGDEGADVASPRPELLADAGFTVEQEGDLRPLVRYVTAVKA